MLLWAAVGLLLVTTVKTTGPVQVKSQQMVLGEGEESQAQKRAQETAKQAEEAQKESQKQAQEQAKHQAESTRVENGRRETEIETIGGQKIKTKVEDDGTAKVEIEEGRLKLKYRVENGRMRLEAEDEAGKEVELEEDDLAELEEKIEDKLEDEGVEISTQSGRIAITRNQVTATSRFPLSVDVNTNQLIVTTPAGEKAVTVLPDQAVANMLATGIVEVAQSTPGGTLAETVKLEIRGDEVIYRVKGVQRHRLLGIIPVTTPTEMLVSAQTGDVFAQERTILARLIDLLSP